MGGPSQPSEVLTFNMSSYSASVLVQSASLLVTLRAVSPRTGVRVSQVVEGGGQIRLDTAATAATVAAGQTGELGRPEIMSLHGKVLLGWLPCTERIYYRRPYAIKNQRKAMGALGALSWFFMA